MLATVQRGLTELMIQVGALDMQILVTSTPKADQSNALTALRQRFSDIALRFPMYMVNVQAALIDPVPIDGLDDAGMAQLQRFLTSAQATGGLIGNLAEAIKSATQDLQAQVSAFQGARINVLTIVTMIFLPISFLTGYFGMNFTWLDNQLDSYWVWMGLGVGLPILLVVLSVVSLARSGYTLPRAFTRRKRTPGG
jgi:magnesium transporter